MKRLIVAGLILLTSTAGAWQFTIPGSLIDDQWISEGSQTSNGGSGTALWFGNSAGTRVIVVGSPNIDDSLAKYGGQCTSFKLVYKVDGKDADFETNDSIKFTWNALKVAPVEAQVTWQIYATGYGWQVYGALGANDEYTVRESDGTHPDSLWATAAVAAGDSITLWGNPAHAGANYWILRNVVINHGTIGGARMKLRSTRTGYGATQMPYFIFYGEAGTGGTGNYKKLGGVKLGSGVKM
jgi:hypothetical protein